MPTITIDPDPPVQGQTAKICSDVTLPATLTVEGRPSGAWVTSIELDENGCAEITVPANGESVRITDPNGQAPALSRIVVAP